MEPTTQTQPANNTSGDASNTGAGAAPTEVAKAAEGTATAAQTKTEATIEKTAEAEPAKEPEKQEADASKVEVAKTEDEKADSTEAEKISAPVELADFKTPEGVALDTEAVSEFKGVAKTLGLNQENAQKVVDIGAKLSQKWAAQQLEQVQKIRDGWAVQSRADREFGGDKFDENLAVAKNALETFGTPELNKWLDDSGLGQHPEIIRLMYKVGNKIKQDKFIPSGTNRPAGAGKSAASVFYPNQNKK